MDHKLKVVFGAACMLLCGQSLAQRVPPVPLPEDKGKAEFIHNCTACHRTEMVLAARKTPEDWRKSVDEMASRGTDGTPEDLDKVVFYLDKYFALDTPASPDTKQPAAPPQASNGPAMLNAFDVEQLKHVIALSTNDVGKRHTGAHLASGNAASKSTGEALNTLVRYLMSLPPSSL